MIHILGLLLPKLSDPEISLRSKRLEDIISPWLLPGMLSHINSFGASPNAAKARFARLLAYLVAINQAGWRDKLDRNRNGYSFYVGSLSPCVFSYTSDAVFIINCPELTNTDCLTIDAEKVQKRVDMAMSPFLRKIFPQLRESPTDPNPEQLTLLWILYECFLKLSASSPFKLSDSLPDNLVMNTITPLYFKNINVFFKALKSGDHIIGFVCNKNLPHDFTWTDCPA